MNTTSPENKEHILIHHRDLLKIPTDKYDMTCYVQFKTFTTDLNEKLKDARRNNTHKLSVNVSKLWDGAQDLLENELKSCDYKYEKTKLDDNDIANNLWEILI